MLPTSLYRFRIATAVMESLPEVKSFCVYQDPFIENLEKEKETRLKELQIRTMVLVWRNKEQVRWEGDGIREVWRYLVCEGIGRYYIAGWRFP